MAFSFTMASAACQVDDESAREAGNEPASGKADGALTWHDFFYDGRFVLDTTWRLASSPDEMVLDIPDSSDPSKVLRGRVHLYVPCQLYDRAPESVGWTPGSALLAGVLGVLDGLDSLHCFANDGWRWENYPISVFPYAERQRLLSQFRRLSDACGAPGPGGVQFFEWTIPNHTDALRPEKALGCFRVETSSGVPHLWMRVADGSRPAADPSDWFIMVDANAVTPPPPPTAARATVSHALTVRAVLLAPTPVAERYAQTVSNTKEGQHAHPSVPLRRVSPASHTGETAAASTGVTTVRCRPNVRHA